MMKQAKVTYKVLDYSRLETEQIESQLKAKRLQLSVFDTEMMTAADDERLLDICLHIQEIKRVLSDRQRPPGGGPTRSV